MGKRIKDCLPESIERSKSVVDPHYWTLCRYDTKSNHG
jgi:hypothetical protein